MMDDIFHILKHFVSSPKPFLPSTRLGHDPSRIQINHAPIVPAVPAYLKPWERWKRNVVASSLVKFGEGQWESEHCTLSWAKPFRARLGNETWREITCEESTKCHVWLAKSIINVFRRSSLLCSLLPLIQRSHFIETRMKIEDLRRPVAFPLVLIH